MVIKQAACGVYNLKLNLEGEQQKNKMTQLTYPSVFTTRGKPPYVILTITKFNKLL